MPVIAGNWTGIICLEHVQAVMKAKYLSPNRFSKTKSDRHCDSKKKNNVYDGIILNPLIDIPAFPNLWKIADNSTEDEIFLQPDSVACTMQCPECLSKAEKTLEVLNLNCEKLAKFRAAAISELINTILEEEDLPHSQAVEAVMEAAFNAKTTSWPPFFSTIRAYFGEYAEKQLQAIGYNG